MTGKSFGTPAAGKISGLQTDGAVPGSEKRDYIATFYSHFGAMSFKKHCDRDGYPARIMPVPRALSSSCGTCVRFTGDFEAALSWKSDELEQIAEQDSEGAYRTIWENPSDS